jgi:hypothetical protein
VIKNCPICGKAFDVQWPHLWRYKRDKFYLCSWKCIRLFDEKGKEAKPVKETSEKKRVRMNPDDMAEALRLFKAGDSRLDQYLENHGITNIPKWKSNAKIRYGEPEAPTLGDAMAGMKDAADEFFGKCKEMGLKTITDEDVEAIIPEVDPTIKSENLFTEEELEFEKRTTVTAIRVEGLGEFYFDKKFKAIDWRTEGGDEVSLGPAWWLQLAEDLPLILKKLGVES